MLVALALASLRPGGRFRLQEKRIANPFPASGAVSGWQKTDATRIFAAKDLWQYIDGDSEHFIQAGVVSTATSDYAYNRQLEAVVDVHTMSGSEGARKILEPGSRGMRKTIQIGR